MTDRATPADGASHRLPAGTANAQVPEIATLAARLRDAPGLPELLDVSFGAFEVIRQLARSCDSQVPHLFAAFMMAADAAVEGREAITAAPALRFVGAAPPGAPPAGAGLQQVAAVLAALAALLAERLAGAATLAAPPGDRQACAQAAAAARRIHHLMAP